MKSSHFVERNTSLHVRSRGRGGKMAEIEAGRAPQAPCKLFILLGRHVLRKDK